MSKKIEEAFNECFERLLSGESLNSCLSSYPEYAAELDFMLRTAFDVKRKAFPVQPRPEFRYWSRIRMQGIQDADYKQPVSLKINSYNVRRNLAISMAAILVFVLASSGTAAASSDAMPDQPLYEVKLAVEQVEITFTPSETAKAELYANLAEKRAKEIAAMASKGKTDKVLSTTTKMYYQLDQAEQLLAKLDSSLEESSGATLSMPAIGTISLPAQPSGSTPVPTVTAPAVTVTPAPTPNTSASAASVTTAPNLTAPVVKVTPAPTTNASVSTATAKTAPNLTASAVAVTPVPTAPVTSVTTVTTPSANVTALTPPSANVTTLTTPSANVTQYLQDKSQSDSKSGRESARSIAAANKARLSVNASAANTLIILQDALDNAPDSVKPSLNAIIEHTRTTNARFNKQNSDSSTSGNQVTNSSDNTTYKPLPVKPKSVIPQTVVPSDNTSRNQGINRFNTYNKGVINNENADSDDSVDNR